MNMKFPQSWSAVSAASLAEWKTEYASFLAGSSFLKSGEAALAAEVMEKTLLFGLAAIAADEPLEARFSIDSKILSCH